MLKSNKSELEEEEYSEKKNTCLRVVLLLLCRINEKGKNHRKHAMCASLSLSHVFQIGSTDTRALHLSLAWHHLGSMSGNSLVAFVSDLLAASERKISVDQREEFPRAYVPAIFSAGHQQHVSLR